MDNVPVRKREMPGRIVSARPDWTYAMRADSMRLIRSPAPGIPLTPGR